MYFMKQPEPSSYTDHTQFSESSPAAVASCSRHFISCSCLARRSLRITSRDCATSFWFCMLVLHLGNFVYQHSVFHLDEGSAGHALSLLGDFGGGNRSGAFLRRHACDYGKNKHPPPRLAFFFGTNQPKCQTLNPRP